VVVKKSSNDYNDDNDTGRFASEMNRPLTDLTSSLLEDILEPNPGEISITNLQVLLLLLVSSINIIKVRWKEFVYTFHLRRI